MPDILDHSKIKLGSGIQTTQIGCDMPESTSADILGLFVSFVQYRDLNATMVTPSGWTGSDVTSVPSGSAIYYRTGGNTTPVAITFTGNDVCAVAICFTISNQKSSSPLTLGSSHSSGGFTHVFSAATTAPHPGAVFVCAVTSPDSNTAFDVTGGTELASEGGGMTKLAIPPYVTGGTNPLSIGYYIANAAGDTVSVTFASRSAYNPTSKAANTAGVGFWISPSQAPSAPTFTNPTTNQLYAIGRTVNVNYLAAVDPNVAQSALTYVLEYTTNGLTWNALTTTGAGILTYAWNTAGVLASSTVQVRGKAYNATEYGPWGYSDVFTLLTDAAPLAPQNVLPTGIVNQAADLTITFTFNDPGDLQKTLEVQYSVNSDMSSPSTTGTITTANGYYTFTASTGILLTTGTRYYRVRNQGVVDSTNGAWSSIKTIIVTAPISAPNITSPTAASPPVSGTHTATFTGTGHDRIQYRILKSGVAHYESGVILTSGNSFVIGIGFADGFPYTLYLKRAASDGLWSTEDSETFTPDYTGPLTPVVTVTAVDAAGYIQILIANTDTIEGQYIFIDGVQLDTPLLPADTVFNYAGAKSGVQISIVVRAFIVTGTGGYTDSVADLVTQNLTSLFLFEPTKESTTANYVAAPIAILASTNEPEPQNDMALVRFRKREKSVAHFRRGSHIVLNYNIMSPLAQISVIDKLEAWVARGAQLRAYDHRAHSIFGKVTGIVPTDFHTRITLPLTITENDYVETVS